MKQIRIIPEGSLCPHCGQGMMITSTMKESGKKLGLHSRKLPAKCDTCGKPGSVVKNYIGIVVESKEPPDQSFLFPDYSDCSV